MEPGIMPSRARATFAALGIAIAIVLTFGPQRLATHVQSPLVDFNAFYCAGQTIDRGADPYRSEPLGTCERAARPPGLYRGVPGIVTPAPLPGYALAPFALLARLPYGLAAALWTALLLAAFALTVAVLARSAGIDPLLVIATLGIGDGAIAIVLGEVSTLAIAALVVAAALVERGRVALAAVAVSVAMIEPHVALPCALALAILRPRAIPALAAGAMALGALSLVTLGAPENVEYVRQVLPAHAFSELANVRQFGLAHLLYRIGIAPHAALFLASAQYAAFAALAVVVARAGERRFGRGALVIFVPMAFAVTGGAFVHYVQVVAALPLALVCLRLPGVPARAMAASIIALSLPWANLLEANLLLVLAGGYAAALVTYAAIDRRPIAAALAAAAALLSAMPAFALLRAFPDAGAVLRHDYAAHALAEVNWHRFVEVFSSTNAPAYDIARLPTVLGLVTLGICAAAWLLPAASRSTVAPGTPRPNPT